MPPRRPVRRPSHRRLRIAKVQEDQVARVGLPTWTLRTDFCEGVDRSDAVGSRRGFGWPPLVAVGLAAKVAAVLVAARPRPSHVAVPRTNHIAPLGEGICSRTLRSTVDTATSL